MRRLLPVSLVALALSGCGDEAPASSPGGAGGLGGSAGAGAGGAGAGGVGAGGAGAGQGGGAGQAGVGAGQGGGGAAGAAGAAVCGTGNGALPAGLVELKWDEGPLSSKVAGQSWSIDVNGNTYKIAEQPRWEAVRFDLEHPAKVYGFSVQWVNLPPDAPPELELPAGIFADFGHNGFDFWRDQPLWQGTRCAGDVKEGEWVTYALSAPIEVAHPGLIYVAHQAEDPEGPAFPFEKGPEGETCEIFDRCHSAINMPGAEAKAFYNGLSLSLPHRFAVRLHVEYTGQIAPEERVFQPAELPVDPRAHVSFGDYDDDGWDDMITDGPTLLRNNGDGTFSDATAQAKLAGLSASGGVFADFDNDGCLDLFLYAESYLQADTLLRNNCDGTFTDVTAAAGIVDHQEYQDCGDPANTRSPTAAAAWVDLDADGFVDLYLANFICWAKEAFYADTVYHNKGDGTFEDWSGTRGFSKDLTASRGAAPIDFDQDGDVDLLVNNYRLQANFFFDNNGDGTVKERGKALGLAGIKEKGSSYYGHTIGVAWGDLDNDGDFDQIAANLAHPRFYSFSDKTQVLLQGPDHKFTDIAGDWAKPSSAAGLRYQETHSVPALADFDHDGNLDLVISAVYDGRPTDFYWGQGDGTFKLDAYRAGVTTTNGWGVASSDWDNDGDPDVFAHRPFVNTLAQKGRWLQVRVVGNVAANRAGIGAVVRVEAGGKGRLRQVQGGSGQGNQDSMYLHFGLGDAASIDAISVRFPGGKVVDFKGPIAADQRVWLFEDGSLKQGWKPLRQGKTRCVSGLGFQPMAASLAVRSPLHWLR